MLLVAMGLVVGSRLIATETLVLVRSLVVVRLLVVVVGWLLCVCAWIVGFLLRPSHHLLGAGMRHFCFILVTHTRHPPGSAIEIDTAHGSHPPKVDKHQIASVKVDVVGRTLTASAHLCSEFI